MSTMAPTPTNHFLITYDIAREHAHVDAFGQDNDAALTAYSAAEAQHRGDANIEVVLLGADSLETLKLTHGRYFGLGGSDVPRELRARGLLSD